MTSSTSSTLIPALRTASLMANAPSWGAVKDDSPLRKFPIADLHADSITASPGILFPPYIPLRLYCLIWFTSREREAPDLHLLPFVCPVLKATAFEKPDKLISISLD
jgi:hypothetical protein